MNQLVYKQNTPADSIFVIADGEFQLDRDMDIDQEKHDKPMKLRGVQLATLGKGDSFGNDDVLNPIKRIRTSSARCVSAHGAVLEVSVATLREYLVFEGLCVQEQTGITTSKRTFYADQAAGSVEIHKLNRCESTHRPVVAGEGRLPSPKAAKFNENFL